MVEIRDLFAKHNLRCTQQRMAVYETLRESVSHPTAEELFRLVKPRMGKLSLATVYNTLEALSGAGLVRRMPTNNGCCRYDANTHDHLHVSFRGTSELRDVPAALSDALIERLPRDVIEDIGRRLGVVIDGVNIELVAEGRPAAEDGDG
ncbi:MAG: transcriptional repressor [Phycisphaerales bacterium]|nr:transcriptional repressor [Phycisphaerae bacterium]NNF44392.1 transcriptional repressor [Phycisphaerales bacterium]NNM26268.1 transcriptional repressor [Phycisphaerales bacterium]